MAKEEVIRGGSITRVQRLKKEISKLLVKEEQRWKQRSRALWLQEGETILSISIVEHLIGLEEIELTLLKIRVGRCA